MTKGNKGKPGAALINKFNKKHNIRNGKNTTLHPKEVTEIESCKISKFQSMPEESEIDAVLYKIEADENRSFLAERRNVEIFNPNNIGLLTIEEKSTITWAQKNNTNWLQIPRRPKWDKSMNAVELDEIEHLSFNSWRRMLSVLSTKEGIHLTPYEKNIEFWRQLWRVTERSDLLVQIVDARDPLLYWCVDLKNYVHELNPLKKHLILINKADFLNMSQKEEWVAYFNREEVSVVFFSALDETDELLSNNECHNDSFKPENFINQPLTLSRLELIQLFESYDNNPRYNANYLTVGLVGYPNVGKSSTINCLLQGKKVAVSATPGKTKHFQTIFLSKELVLCDCPGLIFPAFVSSKEEMIVSGILSIDQMKDNVGPINEIISKIPRGVLETTYGIELPTDKARVTTEDLLNTIGYIRGFMTPGGMPDRTKSARYILKDFVSGQLLYCKAPPSSDQEKYFIPAAVKERKLDQKSVAKVLIKNEVPSILSPRSDVQPNFINNPKKRATPGESGKWWKEALKEKRNTHVKGRRRFPNQF